MKIFPSSSIKKLDAYTIENEPIASIDLMERAATVLTKAITDRWNTETPVTIFAGPGNNGGDALAVARMMAEKGYKIEVFLFNTKGELSPDCQTNKELVEMMEEVKFHEISTQFVSFMSGIKIDFIYVPFWQLRIGTGIMSYLSAVFIAEYS